MVSEPVDVPLGISLTMDGNETFIDYSSIPASPLRKQLRDGNLAVFIDRGGQVRSAGTAIAYRDAARVALLALQQNTREDEKPLDIRTISIQTLHKTLFEGRMSPASVQTTLARRLLVEASELLENTSLLSYLGNIRLHGYAKASEPYTDEQLVAVLDWCKSQLNAMFLRRSRALAAIGADPEAADSANLECALKVLNEPLHALDTVHNGSSASISTRVPDDYRWWVAQIYARGFDIVPPEQSTWRPSYRRAMRDLFPTSNDATAAALLVINEYGAEGSLLVSLDVSDIRREPNNSAVMIITGLKTRADKAVSRRGNAVSTWSGGRVLERWVLATDSARRWTGTNHLWLWTSMFSGSAKTVRAPFHTFIPARPIIVEGHKGIPVGNGDDTVRLSTRAMRKTWSVRADRALGAGFNGSLDPNHAAGTAWAFYRSVSLSDDEKNALIAESQDEYVASVMASGAVINDQMSRSEAIAALVARGVEPAAASKILAGRVHDSGTTNCRDPRSAPDQAEGTLCRKTPFACLVCPNAVHTIAHLPVIIALGEHIEKERQETPAEQFITKWNGVDIGVQRVIQAFSVSAINGARREIDLARNRVDKLRETYG